MHRGYIKIWRKLEDSGLLQMHGTFALFVYMLLQATHKDIRIGMSDIKRGQFISGRHKLAAGVGLSEQATRTSLERLHKLEMITSEPTNQFTIYTIVNYGQYQAVDTDNNQDGNQPATNQQPTSNQPATTIQEHKHINTKEHNNKQSSPDLTFDEFLQACKDNNEKPIPETDSIYAWAEKVKLPENMLMIAWTAFKRREWKDAKGKVKKYKDWRKTFRQYCENPDWLDVFSINREGEYFLTAKGKLLEREIE